ncbi:MAG: carboxypeptidase regulatory-like domain-containing protein [Gammaproteobacteria bacterium]|nr:carboxypeptidase regulatory-like domain-containing protein [Gammaproteobacteria bacterium]
MDTKGLEKPIVMALIYGIIFSISAVIAFVLFKFLPSTASVEGAAGGYAIKASGAIAGFIASFWVWHRAYLAAIRPKRLMLSGNVFDESGNYVEQAEISVDGVSTGKQKTRENGFFEIDVNEQSEYTVRARTKERIGMVTASAKEMKKPVRIVLKKKARTTG